MNSVVCAVGDENPIRCLGNYCEDLEKYEWVRQMLLAFYLIVSNILLLNMLIAVFTWVLIRRVYFIQPFSFFTLTDFDYTDTFSTKSMKIQWKSGSTKCYAWSKSSTKSQAWRRRLSYSSMSGFFWKAFGNAVADEKKKTVITLKLQNRLGKIRKITWYKVFST